MSEVQQYLPARLTERRLVVGDHEQVKALGKLEQEREVAEQRQRDIDEGILKKFEVTISYSGTIELSTYAANEEDARAEAEDEPFDCYEAEIDDISIREASR